MPTTNNPTAGILNIVFSRFFSLCYSQAYLWKVAMNKLNQLLLRQLSLCQWEQQVCTWTVTSGQKVGGHSVLEWKSSACNSLVNCDIFVYCTSILRCNSAVVLEQTLTPHPVTAPHVLLTNYLAVEASVLQWITFCGEFGILLTWILWRTCKPGLSLHM